MIKPQIVVEPDYAAMSRRAAAIVDAAVREHPRIALALPTGNTPIQTYACLVELQRANLTDWSQVTIFNLESACFQNIICNLPIYRRINRKRVTAIF